MMSDSNMDSYQFWRAVKIWLKNSHVVNRRLSGVLHVLCLKLNLSGRILRDIVENILKVDFSFFSLDSIQNIFNSLNLNLETVCILSESVFYEEFESLFNITGEEYSSFIIIQKLLPRTSVYKETYRIVSLDTCEISATFNCVIEKNDKFIPTPNFPYSIKLISNEIKIDFANEYLEDPSAKWLNEKLLPRIIKWGLADCTNNNGILESSIHLVSLEEYNSLYQRLKIKYGQIIVKIWPETTDPSKFVYEDIAIASYLLLLWKNERQNGIQKLQTFIDLGCGNGLLVYILASEGHSGRGIDVRKRGIWDMYPDFVKLEVDVINPSKQCLYENVDWIIGNHSDELSPWIPVITARNSYNCKFFLLPCCAYEFDGSKYQRQNSSMSQYNEYLDYIKNISEKCGFKTDIDRLRIPSTKRICLIGSSRLYNASKYQTSLLNLRYYIEERCKSVRHNTEENDISKENDNWIPNFKPREAEETVRNCTKIEKSIINNIVEKVSTFLLEEENIIDGWNTGKCCSLNEVAKSIPETDLKALRSECGGLQTLLKNNHHIFEVVSGNVKLRYPRTKDEVLKSFEMKKKKSSKSKLMLSRRPCWFFNNHPNKCPLDDDECSYLHE